jgi:hypothetical protein
MREAANRMQICSWRMDQARWETYMHSMHEASLQHVQTQKKGKLRFSCQQSSKNAADRLCYDCDRKRCSRCNKEKGYKEFSHAVLDLDVGSPDLLRTERVAGPNKEDFGNALISVAASRNLVLSSALPSQSSDMECAVILNNAMLAYRDMKQK